MLIPVLILIAVMSLITEAMLSIGLVSAKVAVKEKAAMYADIALDRAVAEHLEYVRGIVGTNGSSTPDMNALDPQTLWLQPACIPVPQALSGPPVACPMTYSVTIELTGGTPVAASLGGPSNSNWLATTFVNEQKVAEAITVQIVSPSGAVLAERSRLLILREFDNAPFVAITGMRDASTSAISPQSGVGDSGGVMTTPDGVLAAPGVVAANDTAIRIITVCQQHGLPPGASTPNGVSGDPLASEQFRWGANGGFGVEAPCNVVDIPAHKHQTVQWNTGTQNSGVLAR